MPIHLTHHIIVLVNDEAKLLHITAQSRTEAMIEANLIGRNPIRLFVTVPAKEQTNVASH